LQNSFLKRIIKRLKNQKPISMTESENQQRIRERPTVISFQKQDDVSEHVSDSDQERQTSSLPSHDQKQPSSDDNQQLNMKSKNELTIESLLEAALELGASDIHFSAGERIAFRVDGNIHFVENRPSLTLEEAESLVFSLVSSEEQKESLMRTRELDTAYEHTDGTNFRVNVFYKRNNISAVLRVIASDAFGMDELGMPAGVKDLLEYKQGLLLLTGPTGAGKSTSMQSMIDHINKSRVEHIITIEDPIEFIFKSRRSIISQREVGSDTLSFSNALRASLREDPGKGKSAKCVIRRQFHQKKNPQCAPVHLRFFWLISLSYNILQTFLNSCFFIRTP
jgi:type II secretory ATPase GspE/PulE/Tfp pilus assembly ATPase PilB-like protein